MIQWHDQPVAPCLALPRFLQLSQSRPVCLHCGSIRIIIFCDVSRAAAVAEVAVVERWWCEGNVNKRSSAAGWLRVDSSLIVKTSPDSTARNKKEKTLSRDTGSCLLCFFRALFDIKRVACLRVCACWMTASKLFDYSAIKLSP